MKNKLTFVIPECYVDTNLVELLLDCNVNHQHCCSKVVGTMIKSYGDSFAIGIIDKDKVELGYLRECDVLAQKGHLTIHKHRERHHYLITIAPAVDKFILDCAKEQNVDLDGFYLPSNLKSFTRETKQVTSNKDGRFKQLFSVIAGNSEMMALKNVLKYLSEYQYKVDLNELKSLFAE